MTRSTQMNSCLQHTRVRRCLLHRIHLLLVVQNKDLVNCRLYHLLKVTRITVGCHRRYRKPPACHRRASHDEPPLSLLPLSTSSCISAQDQRPLSPIPIYSHHQLRVCTRTRTLFLLLRNHHQNCRYPIMPSRSSPASPYLGLDMSSLAFPASTIVHRPQDIQSRTLATAHPSNSR